MTFFKKIYKNQLFIKSYHWLKLISITGSAQIIIQAIGFISGIIVIRTLSTQEYALYTLSNTLLGTMVILGNGGITTGVTALGGRVWQNKQKLGEVLVTGLNLKRQFAFFTLVFCLPVLMYLLLKNGASWLTTILIVLALIPTFIFALSSRLLEIVPKLEQDIIPLQKNQLIVNFGRLLLLSVSVFIFPFAFIAILSSGLPQIWGNLNLRKITSKHISLQEQQSPNIRKDILVTVKRIYPQAFYSSFSGQVTIWLLSIFGTTSSIAQIGALGRVAIVLSFVGIIFNILITPRFARLEENFKLLFNKYIQLHGLLIIVFTFLILLVYIFSNQILWILGSNYAHLHNEIVLATIGSSLSAFAGIIYGLYSQRGWILNPVISILLNISVLALAIFLTDVTTLKGVLILNIILWFILSLINSFYGLFRILKLKND
ncbi:Membrane protein involved in the export of O-antigen and teichoic acid [Flaviramulus basaltis]|uniref:Membrane protein involved in the export of O-antigen and teichoic acid n=1 Tax=Flaviramulus basaltis TaxID=369401 RepID=A0A1K2INJ2_9FLAO|nr:polysaccharide biosynthesis protein [Flaviramulus basaltis]SFZ94017.1 Membrane protein involved in the export of O-antigen and teichoic acid [Flaviramulus basaltis]